MFEDLGSTRIDLACPHCQKVFKVQLRKLHFGADLTCRLCRHEFAASEISGRPEVQEALARMQQIIAQRVRPIEPPSQGRTVGMEEVNDRLEARLPDEAVTQWM